jgi:pyruvate/oxaloacetate carboxyltransferase
VHERFRAVKAAAPPHIQLRAHFHNTRNTALANAVAAVEEGVRVLDGSLAGIGGCPFAPGAAGNVPTEDLLYMFNRMGFDTGVDLDRADRSGAIHWRRARAQDAWHGEPRAESGRAHKAADLSSAMACVTGCSARLWLLAMIV